MQKCINYPIFYICFISPYLFIFISLKKNVEQKYIKIMKLQIDLIKIKIFLSDKSLKSMLKFTK